MSARVSRIGALVALMAVAATAAAAVTVATDQERADTAERAQVREEDRDVVRTDIAGLEQRLEQHAKSVGHDLMPVRDEPVLPPKGVSENILTGELVIGDFKDTFIDEGIVLRGIRVRERKVIRLTRDSNGDPQPPYRIRPGLRMLQVDLMFTNRSGDAADPACGLTGSFNGRAVLDDGEAGTLLTSYDTVGTYAGACNAGIPDGSSGMVALAVGMREKDRLKALQFAFLGDGEDSDSTTQVLVFDEAV